MAGVAASAPDFAALRATRDAEVKAVIAEMWAKMGGSPDETPVAFVCGASGCYCACASNGPCEHNWDGWREFDDGCGFETYCTACGSGSMAHDMWLGD